MKATIFEQLFFYFPPVFYHLFSSYILTARYNQTRTVVGLLLILLYTGVVSAVAVAVATVTVALAAAAAAASPASPGSFCPSCSCSSC